MQDLSYNRLHFVFNGQKAGPISRETSTVLIFWIYLSGTNSNTALFINKLLYFAFRKQNSTWIEVVVGRTGKVIELKVVSTKSIIEHDRFFKNDLISMPVDSVQMIFPNILKDDEYYLDIDRSTEMHLFPNAMVIMIENYTPVFFLHDAQGFGVMTDDKWRITGFVVFLGLDDIQDIRKRIRDDHNIKIITTKNTLYNEIDRLDMKFTGNIGMLFESIWDLQGVNILYLMLYGYMKYLINGQIFMEFAADCVLKNKLNGVPVIRQLAELSDKKHTLIPEIIEPYIHEMTVGLEDYQEIFNKIWIYLTVTVEFRGKHLLKD